jgi:hypothetical protein
MKRRQVAFLAIAGSLLALAVWLRLQRGHAGVITREAIAYEDGSPAQAALRQDSPGAAHVVLATPETPRVESELDRALGPPRWKPRPEGEWDGMLVNLNVTPPWSERLRNGAGMQERQVHALRRRCGMRSR